MWFFRRFRRRRILRDHPIHPQDWQEVLAELPIVDGLSPVELESLRELCTWFLQEKSFVALPEGSLLPAQRLRIAALACLPILHLGIDWYSDWRTLLVYPGEFVSPRREVDAGGIHHEWEEVLSGESWELGPVVLSWADVEVSGMGDGYNVVIHEMAHKLDMRNGDADGFPPLHRNMRTSVWTRDFSDAFQHLQQNVERGVEPPLDHYAGETPAEFFAVSSEYFFEQPWVLWEEYPRVYEQLRQFYQQDPHARWRERSGPSSISGGKP